MPSHADSISTRKGEAVSERGLLRQTESDGSLAPCIIVIFGATGDLTSRKLIPALYALYLSGSLPKPFLIVGCGRREVGTDEFRGSIGEAVKRAGELDMTDWAEFEESVFYQHVLSDSHESFKALSSLLDSLDTEHRTMGNRLFYLAVPPGAYEPLCAMLGQAGLAREGEDGKGWSRIIVEKPFGTDLESARALTRSMLRNFQEHQIFRIDHYLAKETVQNLLVFRFANAIFEPLWNRMYIDRVEITAAEKLGVENRADYYESSGVLRDMFQNHLMQLLALLAMEPPDRFEDEHVRDEKIKVFRSLRPFPLERTGDRLVLAQYTAGTIDGRPVPAYRDESGVNPESLTATYAMMKVFLDNWRWKGVPFYLTSGKRLADKLTQIVIRFKEVPHSMFEGTIGEVISPNRLILGIYPEEKISLTFQTKTPGSRVSLKSVTMDFDYLADSSGPMPDAYQKAIMDAIRGDHMLFWRKDGVEASWAFLDPVIIDCETCYDRVQQLQFYPAGTHGPEAAYRMIESNSSDE